MNPTHVSSFHEDGPLNMRTVFFFKPLGAKRARKFSFTKAFYKTSAGSALPHLALLLIEETENAKWKAPYLLTVSPSATEGEKEAPTHCRIRLFPAVRALPDRYALHRKAARILIESGIGRTLSSSDVSGEEVFDINADAIPTIDPDRLTGLLKELVTI